MKTSKMATHYLCLLAATCLPAYALADEENRFTKDADYFGQLRYRYEFVDQQGLDKRASASTARLNFGVKSGVHNGLSMLAEGQVVRHLGGDNFNDLSNRKTNYPTVADPEVVQVNRLLGQWQASPQWRFKVGRQDINWDNQRFIGTVNWRQNDQTFDAALATYTAGAWAVDYGYLWHINRIVRRANWDSDSHVFHITYQPEDRLKFSGYGYLFSFDEAPSASTQTYGLRATGSEKLAENWQLNYEAEFAAQQDYHNNPDTRSERYYHIAPAIRYQGLTVKAGYEVLSGNGSQSFQTPLATLHAHNGWADKFTTTPAQGLRDAYAGIAYKRDDITVGLTHHTFRGDTGGQLGEEIDIAISADITLPQLAQKPNVLLKYASYKADALPLTDTTKVWLQLTLPF